MLDSRFWSKVEKTDSCWNWVGYRNSKGYGQFHVPNSGKYGDNILAHRFAWALSFGDPGSSEVMHQCDNRACVNPAHLLLGTQHDNMLDMIAKGRGRSGIRQKEQTHCKHGHSLSGENLVLRIKDGYTYRACRTCRNEAALRRHPSAHRDLKVPSRFKDASSHHAITGR